MTSKRIKEILLNDRFAPKIFSILSKLFFPIVNLVATIQFHLGKFVGNLYRLMWPFLGKSWFDHRFDVLLGPSGYHFLERGVFSNQRIKDKSKVLNIGFGDGFLDYFFYSEKSSIVDAIDIDNEAYKFAKNRYHKRNVHFHKSDAKSWLSKKRKYDLVLMFAVIEHLDVDQGFDVLRMISKSLNRDGLLFGSTPILPPVGGYNFEHQNEFLSEKQLLLFLKKVFKKVKIFSIDWDTNRKECYFECQK